MYSSKSCLKLNKLKKGFADATQGFWGDDSLCSQFLGRVFLGHPGGLTSLKRSVLASAPEVVSIPTKVKLLLQLDIMAYHKR